MQIIDRNKDYYDYLSRVYGVDEKVVFDRRGSTNISQELLRNIAIKEPGYYFDKTQYFVLEVGNTQFLFQIENIERIQKGDFRKGTVDIFDGEWSLFKTFKEDYHFGKREMSIAPCSVKEIFNRKKRKMEIITTSFKETCKFNKNVSELELPIVKDTIIPSIIDPFSIWIELSNFISSKNNDKKIDIQMTDVEKVVNHGFDKKSSFRNPIKI